MSGLVDVMDDLAKVGLEISLGKVLQVGERCGGNVPLPLQVALSCFNHISDSFVLLTKLSKGLGELELISRNGTSATRQDELLLGILRAGLPGQVSGLPHVGGEDNQVEVLVDVVHDLGLQEGLGSVIHDLVAELGLSNVLSQLLDASTPGLGRAILVNDLVTLPLGGLSISSKVSHQLFDDLKLSSEEGVLARVHLLSVHLEQGKVHAGDSLNQTLERGRNLELLVEARDDTASGGSGQTNLVIDNDGSVDAGAHQGVDNDVKVSLQRSTRVAHGHPHVDQARVLLLQLLNMGAEGLDVLDLNLLGILVDVHILELATILLR